jgi:hypothetical protein
LRKRHQVLTQVQVAKVPPGVCDEDLIDGEEMERRGDEIDKKT